MRIVGLCLGVCLLFVFPVYATPVTFDFSLRPDGFNESANFSTVVDGLGLGIEASSDNRSYALITWSANYGLGVRAEDESAGTMDGSGGDDRLLFTFGTSVRLMNVGFSWVNDDDRFELEIPAMADVVDFIDISGTALAVYDFASLSLISDSFGLQATESDASFRIKSFTVNTLDAPVPTPEPSSWLLLGSGLVGLLFGHKRKSS